MNETEILEFLIKYQKGTLSAYDRDKFDAWYLDKVSKSSLQLTGDELQKSYDYLKCKLPLDEENQKNNQPL